MAAERGKVETTAPAAKAHQLVYRECMKNHGLGFGRYTVDGCGEFLQLNEDSFHCAACGCHRSFHRKERPTRPHISPIPPPSSPPPPEEPSPSKKKRNRLTPDQRKKMVRFASEKLSWRPHKQNFEEIEKFCSEVGISRRAFTVWVYNNKPKLVDA